MSMKLETVAGLAGNYSKWPRSQWISHFVSNTPDAETLLSKTDCKKLKKKYSIKIFTK